MLTDREMYMKINSSEEMRSSTNHEINDIKVAQLLVVISSTKS